MHAVVDALPAHATAGAATIEVSAPAAADARTLLLDALEQTPGAPRLRGLGAWQTVAVLVGAATPGRIAEAAARGRTYVRSGASEPRLDVRLGVANVGAFAGGVARSPLLGGMLEVRVEDVGAPSSLFRLAILEDDGPDGRPARDVTPDYLRRALPAGRYRARVRSTPAGRRWLVGAVAVDREGGARAHAWSSVVAAEVP